MQPSIGLRNEFPMCLQASRLEFRQLLPADQSLLGYARRTSRLRHIPVREQRLYRGFQRWVIVRIR